MAARAWRPRYRRRRCGQTAGASASARGSEISCPHIERSCTSAFYSDRKLGVSETVATAASAIHLFTGNNISPCGDLASRSLTIRLRVDRTNPENRTFRHPDSVPWTEDHRAKILAALYTLLIGNPMLREPPNAASKQDVVAVNWISD